MFKTLIKKVREENSNSSILTENQSEETNGHINRESDEDNSSSQRIDRKWKQEDYFIKLIDSIF